MLGAERKEWMLKGEENKRMLPTHMKTANETQQTHVKEGGRGRETTGI